MRFVCHGFHVCLRVSVAELALPIGCPRSGKIAVRGGWQLENSTDASTECELRLRLAAAYRIFAMLGWVEMIYNHITVRLPAPKGSS